MNYEIINRLPFGSGFISTGGVLSIRSRFDVRRTGGAGGLSSSLDMFNFIVGINFRYSLTTITTKIREIKKKIKKETDDSINSINFSSFSTLIYDFQSKKSSVLISEM